MKHGVLLEATSTMQIQHERRMTG